MNYKGWYWSTIPNNTPVSGFDWQDLFFEATGKSNPFDGNIFDTENPILLSFPSGYYYTQSTGKYYRFNSLQVKLATSKFSDLSISVYPNPTSSILNIDFDKSFIGSISDLSGKKVMNFSNTTIDISQLSSGVYILNIISDDKYFNKKIVKN
jgi:hypothetical protein